MNGMEEMGGRETEDAGERQEDARERRKTFGGRLEAVWRPFGGRRMTFQGLWEDVWRKYDDFGGNVRILEKRELRGSMEEHGRWTKEPTVENLFLSNQHW